jgi:D-alanyl-D-alanine carboxypeptidase
MLPPFALHACAALAALLFASVAPPAAQAQSNAPDAAALQVAVDSIALAALRGEPLPGLSIAVVRGGEPVVLKGYGFADVENDVPATAETVYRIGSITKQFTAAAILRLAEQGRVSLDAPVGEYLSGLPTWADQVTVHQLLNHTSGIRSYTALGPRWMEVMPLERTHEQMVALFRDEPADFAPGERWLYNNSGYYLLGMIIEEVTGKPYAEYLEGEFFRPLGLASTVYCSERPLIKNRAEGYAVQDGRFVNDAPIDMTQPFSAGAYCSTVADLVRWARALAQGQVVSAESYGKMTTPTALPAGAEQAYGYGLAVGSLDGHPWVAHGGGINGFISQLAYYPEVDLAVAVLSNSGSAPSGRIARDIARRALDLSAAPAGAPSRGAAGTGAPDDPPPPARLP